MRVYSNTAVATTLTAPVGAADAVLPVGDTTGWPAPLSGQEGVAAIDYGTGTVELVLYTGLTANSLTGVTRGIDGTAAQAHASGATVRHVASAADVEGSMRASELHPAFLSGEYYQSQYAGGQNVANMLSSRLHAVPFVVLSRTTFDRIAMEVTTATAGRSLRLGIYDDNGSGFPGALLLDAGTVAADTTGFKEITIAQVLSRARYWLVAVSEGGDLSGVRIHSAQSFSIVPQGTMGSLLPVGWRSSAGVAAGALPAVFPAAAGWHSIPRILLRAQ